MAELRCSRPGVGGRRRPGPTRAVGHGSFEAIDRAGQFGMVIATRIVLAAGFFDFLAVTAAQLLSPPPLRRAVTVAGIVGLAAVVRAVSTAGKLLVPVAGNRVARLPMLVGRSARRTRRADGLPLES